MLSAVPISHNSVCRSSGHGHPSTLLRPISVNLCFFHINLQRTNFYFSSAYLPRRSYLFATQNGLQFNRPMLHSSDEDATDECTATMQKDTARFQQTRTTNRTTATHKDTAERHQMNTPRRHTRIPHDSDATEDNTFPHTLKMINDEPLVR